MVIRWITLIEAWKRVYIFFLFGVFSNFFWRAVRWFSICFSSSFIVITSQFVTAKILSKLRFLNRSFSVYRFNTYSVPVTWVAVHGPWNWENGAPERIRTSDLCLWRKVVFKKLVSIQYFIWRRIVVCTICVFYCVYREPNKTSTETVTKIKNINFSHTCFIDSS